MTNMEYLINTKKLDEEKFLSKGRLFEDVYTRKYTEFRKAKALEIIAEELVLAVRELKVLTKAVRRKI